MATTIAPFHGKMPLDQPNLAPEALPVNPAAAVFATPTLSVTFSPAAYAATPSADPAAAATAIVKPAANEQAAPASSSSSIPLAALGGQKNLIAPGVAAVMNGHDSEKIAQAFAQHWSKMGRIRKEYDALADGDKTYNGVDSSKLADAIVEYSKQHSGAVPREVRLALTPNANSGAAFGRAAWSGFGLRAAYSVPANADGSYTIDGVHFTSAPFSMATTVQSLYWAQIIYCIVWIVSGVLLVFNGWASYTWFARAGARERSAILPSGKKVKSRAPILAGGIGGAVVGFLFVSWFVTIIMAAICTRGKAAPAAGSYFAIWLVPAFVLGIGLGGHFKIVARAFAGLLAGISLTLILTAVFGIHTITARAILLSIFCSLFTAPLLLMPRSGSATVHRHLLNVCTSLIGMMTFLTGVALFAPPEDSSAAWIDLWALLFAPDKSASQAAAVSAWGTPAFKGYISGAVLGTIIGCVFEFFIHARAGMDAQEEWNDYLGGYTERFVEKGSVGHTTVGDPGSRAGLFEPAPTGWQRFANLFSDQRPASYGAHPDGNSDGRVAFTELNMARRAKSTRSTKRKTSGGPARFKALARGEKDADLAEEYELKKGDDDDDDDDDDSDATDVESDAGGDIEKTAGLRKDAGDESKDSVAELKKNGADATTTKLENYRGYALPRPPSYRTDSNSSGNGSGLSGTTKASSDSGSSPASSPSVAKDEEVHKPMAVYRDSDRSGSPTIARRDTTATTAAKLATKSSAAATAAPATGPPKAASSGAATLGAPQHMVPATPSLINAITRIQQAQAQAKAWQEAQKARNGPDAPYGAAAAGADASAAGASASPSGANGGAAKFDQWWNKEVKGGKK